MTLDLERSGQVSYQQTISIKLAAKPELLGADHILEFEHSLNPENGHLWYDLSYVTANAKGYKPRAFLNNELHLIPQGDANPQFPTCTEAHCPAGAAQCHDAYKYSKNDAEMRTCQEDTGLMLHLCSANQRQKRTVAPGRLPTLSKASSNVASLATFATAPLSLLASAFWMFG